MSSPLTDAFRDIIDMRWSQFCEMEQSLDATNFDSVVTGIIRACRGGTLRAIQTALDRLDGKVALEIEVEYPKFYYLFPKATATVVDTDFVALPDDPNTEIAVPQVMDLPDAAPADVDELRSTEEELPTGSLRAVLEKMLHSPKTIVDDILRSAEAIDKADYTLGDPMVKSVIVAGLMRLVHTGRVNAVFEVFDQIDGKVADKFKVLGDDVYITRFDLIAPAGAVKNDDGVYQLLAEDTTNSWVARLEQTNKKGHR